VGSTQGLRAPGAGWGFEDGQRVTGSRRRPLVRVVPGSVGRRRAPCCCSCARSDRPAAGVHVVRVTRGCARVRQMLMGGRSLEVSPDDYIFAATQIYLDIINIFLNILQARRRPASSPPAVRQLATCAVSHGTKAAVSKRCLSLAD